RPPAWPAFRVHRPQKRVDALDAALPKALHKRRDFLLAGPFVQPMPAHPKRIIALVERAGLRLPGRRRARQQRRGNREQRTNPKAHFAPSPEIPRAKTRVQGDLPLILSFSRKGRRDAVAAAATYSLSPCGRGLGRGGSGTPPEALCLARSKSASRSALNPLLIHSSLRSFRIAPKAGPGLRPSAIKSAPPSGKLGRCHEAAREAAYRQAASSGGAPDEAQASRRRP